MPLATTSVSALRRRTLDVMEDELRIAPKQADDFVKSLVAVVQEEVEMGNRVALFGLVNVEPRFVPAKPKRKGRNPQTGEEVMLDPKPAEIKVKVSQPLTVLKAAVPKVDTKVGKALKKQAKEKADAAAERKKQREEEEAKAAKKAEREAKAKEKSSGKTPDSKPKASGKKSSGKGGKK